MDRDAELLLVAQVRDGDAEAFDRIYGEFNTRIFSFLARLSRRRDVAEDLLDEMWLRFVDGASRLRPDTQLAPFLFTIARNLHISYCRSRLVEDSQTVDMIGLWPLGTPCPSPFEATLANETGRRVEAALAELPAIYREALLLMIERRFRFSHQTRSGASAPARDATNGSRADEHSDAQPVVTTT
jgi:RNA polymerase sigma factor (sigma-70 family)